MGNSLKSCNFNFDHAAVVVSHISSPNIFFRKVGFYYIIDGLFHGDTYVKIDEGRGCVEFGRIPRCFGQASNEPNNCSPPFVSYIRRD